MYIYGTIDERDEAKEKWERERERREKSTNSHSLFLSASYVLKWTTEKWVIDNNDDDDQATSEKNSIFSNDEPSRQQKKPRVISFIKELKYKKKKS